MRPTTGNPVHRLRHYLAAHDLDAQPDSVLLARFAADRDEGAFTALVRRHSPLVLGTARRMLGNPADADDVLQAVFLTLARKAGAIRCDGTLAPWLYRVTCRAASRLRKRSWAVQPVADRAAESDPLAQMSARELCSAIDAEVARLSAGLRATVVLCCLQGLTRDEAAAQLGWSSATVKRRLARARDLLDRRLRARGIALPAALAPVLLAITPPASAEAVTGTIEAALGRIPPPTRVGALCGASSVPLKTWAAAAIACGVVGVSLLIGLRQPGTPPPQPPVARETPITKPDANLDAQGDPLPAGAVARIGTTRFRHDEWVYQAVWSPDGKYIASTAGETMIVWEADSGRELGRLMLGGPAKQLGGRDGADLKFVRDLQWSRDGRTIFAVIHGWSKRCSWDPAKQKLRFVQNYDNTSEPLVTAMSADGSRLFSASSEHAAATQIDSARIWSVRLPAGSTVSGAVVSPTDELAVIATSGATSQLQVFDMRAGHPVIKTMGRAASRMTFSVDGKSFAAVTEGENGDLAAELWDTRTWESTLRIPIPKPADRPAEVRALALSPDGKTLVTGGGDKTLRWWDTTTGKEIRRVGPGWVYYNRAAFRPDGKVLMTVSHENHVRLWDAASGKELPIGAGPGWLMAATAHTPDGRRVLSVSEHTVYAHDAASGRELWHAAEHTDTAVQIVVTPDGQTAISSGNDGRVIFWDVATGKALRRIEAPRHAVDLIALSPDGRTLAALGNDDHDRMIRRWDVATGRAYPDVPLPGKDAKYVARSIRYSPDGKGLVITSGTETQVLVFDLDRKEMAAAYTGADGGLNWADFSVDGRTVAASTAGGSIFLWEAATGKPRLVLKNVGYTTCLAFSPDGRLLAVINDGSHRLMTRDKTVDHTGNRTVVRLLDSFTGQEIHRFAGHTGSVYRLSWLDNSRLLSASHDSSGLVWDVSAAIRSKLPTARLNETEARAAAAALNGLDSSAVYKEMARLTASPAAAVTALRTYVKPVPRADADQVTALLRDLDSPQFAVRDRGAAQLHKLGDGVEGALRRALDPKLSAEARDRIERLLADLKPSSERLRQGRAMEVLERIGTPDARKLLAEVAGGADGAWLTREAAAGLGRLTPPSR